jgi:adenylate cyclase
MTDAAHTFVFADIVGFTALTAMHGDEAAADVAVDFAAGVRALLPAQRAEEVKVLGDGLMLRGKDPALAIELGLRITALKLPAPVRVGMHTGSAVSRGGDWFGSTVNLAARLCQAAAPGEVLVSHATGQAAGRAAAPVLGGPRAFSLKNVTDPLWAWAARVAPQLELGAPALVAGAGP